MYKAPTGNITPFKPKDNELEPEKVAEEEMKKKMETDKDNLGDQQDGGDI